MLISLFAWTCISLICLIWGNMMGSLLIKENAGWTSGIHPGLTCITGLSGIGVLAMGLSLFMPLDGWAHAIILLPALAWCGRSANRRTLAVQIGSLTKGFSPAGYWLLTACIGMTLIISVHTITHPDTLAYHARSILLFREYAAIPGIANLKTELGFQSSWFAIQAIFQPFSTLTRHIIFVNGAILCWYFLFVIHHMIKSPSHAWAWLLLLIYTLISFTQARLTAASASPDFIVTIYCWAAVYLFIQAENNNNITTTLIMICCIAAVLTKISALAILLLAAAALTGPGRLRQAWPVLIYAGIALLLLLARNTIASGYPLYPTSLLDISNAGWKMRLPDLQSYQHYITMYARFPIRGKEMDGIGQLPPGAWIPRWWREQVSLPDRLLILGIITGIILNGLTLLIRSEQPQQVPRSKNKRYTLLLLITLAGSLLWFLAAPHPRFGTAFLLPLGYLLFRRFYRTGAPSPSLPGNRPAPSTPFLRRLPLLAIYSLAAALTAYSAYRCYHFLTPSEIIVPTGIHPAAYEPLGCENIRVDLEKNTITACPSRQDSCKCRYEYFGGFSPIGTTIGKGFKPAD